MKILREYKVALKNDGEDVIMLCTLCDTGMDDNISMTVSIDGEPQYTESIPISVGNVDQALKEIADVLRETGVPWIAQEMSSE